MNKEFSPQVPYGYKVFIRVFEDDGDEGIQITGLHVPENKEWALKFADGKNQHITLNREPYNKYDKNAVAVIANWKGWILSYSKPIGYIPREIAKEMAKHPPFSNFKAGLNSIYVSADRNYVSIRINLFCREDIESLDDKDEKNRAKDNQELKSLSPVERGLFDTLLDSLNDCAEDYECKSLSTKRLNEVFPIFLSKALNELGISEADFNKTDNDDRVDKIENELLNYEQEIFDEIIRLHPNMKKKS